MTNIIQTCLVIIPLLGLVAGLSLSVTIPIFLLACLYTIKNKAEINLKHSKIEICFTIWLLLSCFWSINLLSSLSAFLKTFSVALVVFILISNREFIKSTRLIPSSKLYIALTFSIALFYFEYFTNGLINSTFRELVQKKADTTFYLYYLDRGCSLLALFSWLVIAVLIKENRNTFAILAYIATILTLYLSDSLSAFIGFLVAGIIFIITKFWPFHNPRILSSILIICSILFIFGANSIEPRELSDNQAKSLPISAKHRLFIWDFALDKVAKKPFNGYGFNSSRNIKTTKQDFIQYEDLELNPLPLHPHNNLIQILLETGIVGFILYLLLATKYLVRWNLYFKKATTTNILNLRSAGYACFSTFFVISMISFNMWQSWWLCSYLWIATLFCFLVNNQD